MHPEDMEGQQAFDGTPNSQSILLQRHQERVLQMGHGYTNTAMQAMREAMSLAQATATQAQSENLRLRERCNQLEEENAKLTGMLDQALGAAEAAEKEAAEESETGKVIQLIKSAMVPAMPAQAGK